MCVLTSLYESGSAILISSSHVRVDCRRNMNVLYPINSLNPAFVLECLHLLVILIMLVQKR